MPTSTGLSWICLSGTAAFGPATASMRCALSESHQPSPPVASPRTSRLPQVDFESPEKGRTARDFAEVYRNVAKAHLDRAAAEAEESAESAAAGRRLQDMMDPRFGQ